MAVSFWELPENLFVAVTAPSAVLRVLSNGIVLDVSPPARQARTVHLNWSADTYLQYKATYWQPEFSQEDVVWKESEKGWLFLGDGFVLVYDQTTDSAHFYAVPERLEDIFIYSYPFLNLLVNLLKPKAYVCLHAAVIGESDRFVLIPGKQNTGKSTTSAAWVLHGGQFVTDDFCFVNAEKPAVAHGFYPTLRLREQALAVIGNQLSPNMLQQKGDSKYFFSLLTHSPERFSPRGNLHAIFCLNIHNARPTHAVADPKTGFEYLASSVAFSVQHRSDGRLCLQAIKKLVHTLPVIRVSLSPDTDENFHYLKGLIESHGLN